MKVSNFLIGTETIITTQISDYLNRCFKKVNNIFNNIIRKTNNHSKSLEYS